MDFGRGSAPECALGAASGSGGGVAKGESLKTEQELLDHLLQREYLALVFGLYRGDRCSDCSRHSARYRLLKGRVYSVRVSYDFRKTGNGFRKLVRACEPTWIVKTRGSGESCSRFSLGNVETRKIY